MADRLPMAIALGVGGAAVGGPEALRLLLAVDGRSAAAADVAICVLLISAFAALVLGTVLLARLLRTPRRNAEAVAPATARLAKLTAAAALVVMFFITVTLLVVPTIPGGRWNAPRGAVRSCSA